ncbi:MAG: amino acid ABC transporter ATP-binding protein [Clostridiales bacterium]|nr:amino acid ABC transporter ATP-binding protein [Clostridiales bacterium]
MLSATEIHKGFDGLGVLRGIDLNVEKGEVVALIGPSGSGKSTLLRCLNQLETVDSGTIVLDGLTLCRTVGGKLTYADPANLRRITLKMGMVFQSYNLFPHMSVMQNLTDAPMRVKRLSRAQATERARELLAKVGLSDKADQYPYQLSGGQQQRVAIARALCMDPEILCFDEPTSALDPELTQEVLGVMRELASERMTMLVVTHEMSFARDVADRVVFMEDGLIVEEGPPEQVFHSANPRTRQFVGEN